MFTFAEKNASELTPTDLDARQGKPHNFYLCGLCAFAFNYIFIIATNFASRSTSCRCNPVGNSTELLELIITHRLADIITLHDLRST